MSFKKNQPVFVSYMKGKPLPSYDYKLKFYAHFSDGKHYCYGLIGSKG